jgi:ribonucleoside-diphosphate reductase alpha chain
MLTTVIKRDGTEVPFDASKISVAIHKAFAAINAEDHWSGVIASEVTKWLPERPTVEQIQDIVEEHLMRRHPKAAKAYNAIAEYIHAAKYAKWDEGLQRRETFEETVDRVRRMHCEKFPKLAMDINRAFRSVYEKKVLPSMRSMQFAGQPLLDHNARMYNCSFTLVDRPRVFSEIMYLLLCGCGCGFSVQQHHIDRLPPIAKPSTLDAFFTIPDTIEGWADAVNELIRGAVFGYNVEFNYSQIRPAGSLLKSGGRAPGHRGLKAALENCRRILLEAQGRRLRPIECHDMICYISSAVLSGGIRRSSALSLFSLNDEEMLYAKSSTVFAYGGKNWQRALANNSAALFRGHVTQADWNKLWAARQHGEPGFLFVDNKDQGCNPCGEIILDPTIGDHTGFAFCNLVEVNATACNTKEEFSNACYEASIIATLQATYTDFEYLTKVSRDIAERDRLIGVSVTGILDNIECIKWMEEGRQAVFKANRYWAEKLGIFVATRLTCIKPSGTASLELGNVSSGVHPHHSKRYFRRIIANPNEVYAQRFREVNPDMVETMPDGNWSITFPAETKGVTLDDVTPEQHLDIILDIYWKWCSGCSGHNVSATLIVDEEVWEHIKNRIWNERNYLAGMTFLPRSSDKEIPFCPREAAITGADMAKWIALSRNYKPVGQVEEKTDETTHTFEAACNLDGCDSTIIVQGNGTYYSIKSRKVEQWTSGKHLD